MSIILCYRNKSNISYQQVKDSVVNSTIESIENLKQDKYEPLILKEEKEPMIQALQNSLELVLQDDKFEIYDTYCMNREHHYNENIDVLYDDAIWYGERLSINFQYCPDIKFYSWNEMYQWLLNNQGNPNYDTTDILKDIQYIKELELFWNNNLDIMMEYN